MVYITYIFDPIQIAAIDSVKLAMKL